MVTHDAMAATIADRVFFLADGRIAKSLARPTQAQVVDAIQEVAGL
jgi:putative ABC transport system ATP-binding protein